MFAELDETDLSQFGTEADFDLDAEESLTADTSTLLDDTGQSAEDVMYAYVEAVKNLDVDAIRSLATEEFLHSSHDVRINGDSFVPMESIDVPMESIDEMPAAILAEIPPEVEVPYEALEAFEITVDAIRESVSQTEVASSEYISDEFHFRLRVPAPEMPEIPGVEVETTSAGDLLFKMRKIDGVWRIYDGGVN